jgi:type I restriction enzyme R subunit
LIRAYANLANEFTEAGYSQGEFETIKKEVIYYTEIRDLIKNSSGDYIDLKKYEADMRRLIDTYIKADDSEVVEKFEEMGVIELLVSNSSDEFENKIPKGMKQTKESMAENIENNVRKLIIDESPTNPKYYEKMSELLDALINERKENAIEYKKYLLGETKVIIAAIKIKRYGLSRIVFIIFIFCLFIKLPITFSRFISVWDLKHCLPKCD